MTEKTYTRDQVSQAVNDGASLVQMDPDIYLSERMYDIINLVVNAAMTVLDDPSATLDEVIAASWQPEPEDDPEYDEDKDYSGETDEEYRARVIRTVRSWYG